jgi:hypothetical protein
MRTSSLAYLCFPAVVAAGAFASALQEQPFGVEMFVAYLLGGGLFYAAPQLLWAAIAHIGKYSGLVWHAGFLAASVALALLLLVSLTSRDPSGLPVQWLAYWPLAVVLQAIVVGASALFARGRSKVGA